MVQWGIVSMDYEDEAFMQLVAVMGASHSKAEAHMHRGMQGEAFVMRTLVCDGPQTPSSLAAAMKVTPGRVSSLIAVLERKGWVSRLSDPSDRRSVRIAITPEGFAGFCRHSREMRRTICWIFSQMGERRSRQFVDLLTEFVTYLSLVQPGTESFPSREEIDRAFEEREEKLAELERGEWEAMRRVFGIVPDAGEKAAACDGDGGATAASASADDAVVLDAAATGE